MWHHSLTFGFFQLSVDVIETHFANALLPRLGGQIDLLYFNPPYVLTPSEEVGSHSVGAAWAGGIDGREVIDKFLPYVKVSEELPSTHVITG